MPLTPRPAYQVPDFWTTFGHSYFQYSFGTFFQTGRADSLFRASLDIEHSNWQNFCVNGARACIEGESTGGYNRVLRRVNRPQRGGPYVSEGGALALIYGINDLGLVGTTAQLKTAYQHAMRTMISRWRASVIFENDFQVGTRTSYGAGFSSVAVTYASGPTVHWCTSTTNANFTLTLPSDYAGEPVAIALVGAGGVSGGIVTWGGTAGVTGTTSTSDIMPSSAVSHCHVIKRITNLTSANAGQTITGTVNTLDSGGAVMLDCWWLEAKAPPPIIVCNIARLPAAGYTSNYPSWSGTEASRDQDVNDWNTALYSVISEFDSMVQIADIDTALGPKDATLLFSDALHPNEKGASRIVDAMRDAMLRLVPTTSNNPTGNFNPSSPRAGGSLRPRISGQWYTQDYFTTTTYTPVAQHLWAIPIWVTQPREFWTRLALEVTTAGSTQSTIRWGLYDDVGWTGYPGELVNEATSGGAFSVANSTGVKNNPASGAGSISWVMNPGLYWLGFKVITVGTSQVLRGLQGYNSVMPNLGTTGLPAAQASAPNGYLLTSQGTGALATTFPSGAVATANAPYVGIQVTINTLNA